MSRKPAVPSDRGTNEIRKRIDDFEANRGTEKETRLSQWVRANQPLLTASGAATAAAVQAIEWLVTHVQDIQQFVDTIGHAFNSPPGIPALDLDALRIFDEGFAEIFPARNDPIFRAVVKQVAQANGYARAISKRHGLDLLVEEL